jgi:hypothetical protein
MRLSILVRAKQAFDQAEYARHRARYRTVREDFTRRFYEETWDHCPSDASPEFELKAYRDGHRLEYEGLSWWVRDPESRDWDLRWYVRKGFRWRRVRTLSDLHRVFNT